MEADGSFGDGQSQSDAAGVSAAGVIEAVKRLKQLVECVGGNSRAAVADVQHSLRPAYGNGSTQLDLNRRSFRSVTDRVADDVLDGAVQQ